MRVNLKLIITLGLLLLAVSIQAADNPLELLLKSSRNIYQDGDEIVLKLEFFNNSDQPLIIYNGLVPELNLYTDIARINTGYESKLSWPRRLYERTQPREDEFVTIAPYGTYKDQFTLQEYMDDHVDLLRKGQYKLTVRYTNDIEGYQDYQPYTFVKIAAWKGKLSSNTITIEIK